MYLDYVKRFSSLIYVCIWRMFDLSLSQKTWLIYFHGLNNLII